MNKIVLYFFYMVYLFYEMILNILVDRIFVGFVGCMIMDFINLFFIVLGMMLKLW